MKPNFVVWYHPYQNPDDCESVLSFATNELDARCFAGAFGWVFMVNPLA